MAVKLYPAWVTLPEERNLFGGRPHRPALHGHEGRGFQRVLGRGWRSRRRRSPSDAVRRDRDARQQDANIHDRPGAEDGRDREEPREVRDDTRPTFEGDEREGRRCKGPQPWPGARRHGSAPGGPRPGEREEGRDPGTPERLPVRLPP